MKEITAQPEYQRLRAQTNWWRMSAAMRFERIAVDLWHRLPRNWRYTLTASTLGELTVRDPQLSGREVPTITVQELLDAMKIGRRS